MAKILLISTAAFLLSLAVPVLAAEEPNTPPPKEDAGAPSIKNNEGEGKTGENAECPIKKMIGGKIYCFQNDPALTKPQGGG